MVAISLNCVLADIFAIHIHLECRGMLYGALALETWTQRRGVLKMRRVEDVGHTGRQR